MAGNHLDTLAADNHLGKLRVEELEQELESQAADIRRAEDRKAELSALRSSALLQFARQHAEEEATKRSLVECRKGITDAWMRIQALQARNAQVCLQQQQHEQTEAKHKRRRDEHAIAVAAVERKANFGAEVLQGECQLLLEAMAAADSRRAEAEAEAQRAMEEAAEQRRQQEEAALADQARHEAEEAEVAAAEAAELEIAAAAEAATAAAAAAAMTDEDIEKAILAQLEVTGRAADAKTILQGLASAGGASFAIGIDAVRLDRALHSLKDSWQCYEPEPGQFAIM